MAATRTLSTKTASRGTKKLASQALLPADCWHLYSCLICVYRSYIFNIACACHCSWAQAVQWLCAYVPLQLRRLRCCGGAAGFASSWHGSIPCSSLPQSAAIKVSLLRCVIEQHINSRGSTGRRFLRSAPLSVALPPFLTESYSFPATSVAWPEFSHFVTMWRPWWATALLLAAAAAAQGRTEVGPAVCHPDCNKYG